MDFQKWKETKLEEGLKVVIRLYADEVEKRPEVDGV
jgi:hypothetical protein